MTVWTQEMKHAAMADAAVVCKQAERIAALEAALREVLSEVLAAPFEPASHVVDTGKISDLLAI